MKKIFCLMLAVINLLMLCSVSFAFNPPSISIKSWDGGDVGGTVGKVLGVMQWIGYAVAIGMIIFCGIKYLMSGAGEKAKVKETLIPILAGAVLIAGATAIATAIFTFTGE